MVARILIVEDDQDLARLLQINLAQSGYRSMSPMMAVKACFSSSSGSRIWSCLTSICRRSMAWKFASAFAMLSNMPILMMTGHAVSEPEIARGPEYGGR